MTDKSLVLKINNTPMVGKQISKLGNQVTEFFDSSIILDGDYELRMINFSCVYCIPNVTSSNNKLVYTYLGLTHTITFDIGLYSLDDINIIIRMFTALAVNGGNSNLFQFTPDEATSKIYVYFTQANFSIDCSSSNSIMPMIGFPASSGIIGNFLTASWIKSPNQAKLNVLTNILVKCDCTTDSYDDGKSSNLIAPITPDVSANSTIIFNPVHPLRCTINKKRLDTITITLVEQNSNNIDLGTNEGTESPELWQVILTINKHERLM